VVAGGMASGEGMVVITGYKVAVGVDGEVATVT
jgi:hypothetical protein